MKHLHLFLDFIIHCAVSVMMPLTASVIGGLSVRLMRGPSQTTSGPFLPLLRRPRQSPIALGHHLLTHNLVGLCLQYSYFQHAAFPNKNFTC
ncbi:hypothetical protein F4777DRAFT_555826 [Nemania sp. FL0916]|nr:hypothetical protein F4777DRAFT_555826 [Nemania sp. FL0916]